MRFLRLSPQIGLTALFVSSLAIADCPQIVVNGDFETGNTAGWVFQTPDGWATMTTAVLADAYTPGNEFLRLTIDADDPLYALLVDAEMSQTVTLVDGATYRLTFWARSSSTNTSVPVRVKVGGTSDPWPSYGLEEDFVISYNAGAGNAHVFEFQATAGGTAGLAFFVGLEDTQLWFDSITLEEISHASCETGSGGSGTGGSGTGGVGTGGAGSGGAGSGGAGSGGSGTGGATGIGGAIHHNQVGYVSTAEKVATLVHASTSPVSWELRNASNTVVESGSTIVSGEDASSGDHVHLIDFSAVETDGSGYRLFADGYMSGAFSIGADVYANLRRDALRFFYHHRASEAISATYSGGSQYARSAGHTDSSVTCYDGSCSYSLDTRFGWYDAGDYGKYVVNGGIALWTLLNLYERTEHLGTDLAALGDSMNNIPESGNGQSDLLDETRKEITFMLGMQVPAGQPLAGMAHHKVHSDEWDTIPVVPAAAGAHLLHAPSTAATLNLAATMAQAARIFAVTDPSLSSTCLSAAETAYAAAVANPNRLAPASDSTGGGAYNDADVSDEFYWAAAELFITTGEATYEADLLASPHHASPPEDGDAFSWPTTATLGLISLATVPSDLDPAEVGAVRASLVLRAEVDAARAAEGYGSGVDWYYWGSNSSVLNSGLLNAVAYDLTGEVQHRAAALFALDYVLGRNPLSQSYVTGYGIAPFENAHHRFWANAFDLSFPKPPPGVLAGGPNQSLDGLSAGTIASLGLTGCAPSTCWSDYADGYSMTEVTVNWNAPLAWLASWASEQQNDPQTDFPGVDVGGDGDGDGDGTGGSATGDGDGDGDIAGDGDGSGDGDGDAAGDGDGDGDGAGSKGKSSDSGGCSVQDGSTSPAPWWMLALSGLVFWSRRRALSPRLNRVK